MEFFVLCLCWFLCSFHVFSMCLHVPGASRFLLTDKAIHIHPITSVKPKSRNNLLNGCWLDLFCREFRFRGGSSTLDHIGKLAQNICTAIF
jgi:hypothetical protein